MYLELSPAKWRSIHSFGRVSVASIASTMVFESGNITLSDIPTRAISAISIGKEVTYKNYVTHGGSLIKIKYWSLLVISQRSSALIELLISVWEVLAEIFPCVAYCRWWAFYYDDESIVAVHGENALSFEIIKRISTKLVWQSDPVISMTCVCFLWVKIHSYPVTIVAVRLRQCIYFFCSFNLMLIGFLCWYFLFGSMVPRSSWFVRLAESSRRHGFDKDGRMEFLVVSIMMTSSIGNIFGATGPFCEEFTDLRWIPCTKDSDAELRCFLWSAPE